MQKEIRVRFAPSPTGHLHIGGGRTALFNYLFAQHHRGKFLLRIEDTDRARSTPEATQGILASLEWLGLEVDEKPYFQSQNLALHRQAIEELLKNELAYHCYCSPEEIEAMRQSAQKKGLKPRYDGRCRNLKSPPDGKEKITPVVRFKTSPSGKVEFVDLIHGEMAFDCAELDDLVILRSDGSPTYNLSVVVDDADMAITHVIRGDDHLNNTPRQILLYQALKKTPPQFAHLSMILGPDKKKLSKRHNVPSILVYRDQGYLPQALINYLVRLGWSHGDQEIFTKKELIEHFSLKDIGSSPAAINFEKLQWLNGHYLRETPANDLWPLLQEILTPKGVASQNHYPEAKICLRIVALLKERTKTLEEMAELFQPYLNQDLSYDPKAVKKFLNEKSRPLIQDLLKRLAGLAQWQKDDLKALFEEVAQKHQVKFIKLAQPVRVCLTGTSTSPGIYDVVEILGKDLTLSRLQQGLAQING